MTSPSKKDVDDHFIHNPVVAKQAQEYFERLQHPYKTESGIKMCKALPNCKNQCWDCHLCEDAYGYEHFDSLAQINRTPDSGYQELKNISVLTNRIDAVSNA